MSPAQEAPRRALEGLAQAAVAVLFGMRTGFWFIALPLTLLGVALWLFGKRLRLGATPQLGFALVGGLSAAFAALLLDGADDGMRATAQGMALGSLLIGLPRCAMQKPWLGERGTAAIVLAGLLALGRSREGGYYFILLGVIALLQIVALRKVDPAHVPWKRLSTRGRWALIGVIGVSLAAGAGLVAVLPPLSSYVEGRLLLSGSYSQTGFGSGMIRLGALAGMLESDELVAEVRGGPVDYLRGTAFVAYQDGHWLSRRSARQTWRSPRAVGGDSVEIRSVGGTRDRYFLPLHFSHLATDQEHLSVDFFGVPRSLLDDDVEWARLQTGPRDPELPRIRPADSSELAVPAELAPLLDSLAVAWSGAGPPRDRLRAVERELASSFSYSTWYERDPDRDPLVDFLVRGQSGHCEYFASALALLGRSLAIPTRVVVGYRVIERNELNGVWLVRERNAHAWVEAWFPDSGWQTFDATPPAGIAAHMPATTPWMRAVAHWLGGLLGAFWDWLLGQSPYLLLLAVAALAAFWIGLRMWRERHQRTQDAVRSGLGFSDPLACLAALEQALATRDLTRAETESLARFAARVEAAPGWGAEAASLLRAYAALRYGGHGREPELAERLVACARKVEG